MHGFSDERAYREAVENAKRRVKEVTPQEAVAMRERGDDVTFLDVREPNEWNLFHVPGAVHVPLGQVRGRALEAVPPDGTVVVYCAAGNRSALAADAMQELGFRNVISLAGGIRGWVDAGGEVDQ